ncbi:MAG TPA: helix-turn-helix domain-containing protein [Xanthobacteraceae bacterium]|jgi:AcrR family transcriptional regulator|nr:helix-turn-helix domain-containing protein [Xanthobacteraceae bacterium]
MAYRRTQRETARLAARHEAIVAAARRLACESGLGAVQIAPVAERAGIAAGTVYRYFPSKDDLVAAVVSAATEREVAAIRAAAAAAPGALSGLAAAIMAFASGTLRARRLAFAMLSEEPPPCLPRLPPHPPPQSAEGKSINRSPLAGEGKSTKPPPLAGEGREGAGRLTFRRKVGGEFEGLIRAAMAAGHLPDQPPAAMAAGIIGATVEGLVGPLAPAPAGPEAERAAVQEITLFALRALGVADARARGLVMSVASNR